MNICGYFNKRRLQTHQYIGVWLFVAMSHDTDSRGHQGSGVRRHIIVTESDVWGE